MLSDSILMAYPNTTSSQAASGANDSSTMFYITFSAGSQAGFVSKGENTSDTITSGWRLYGGILFLNENDTLVNTWFAIPTSTAGIWSLNWNVSDDVSAVPVTIKNAPPSAPPTVS